ncbi:MAG: PAS domain S-box protein [Deltaproteobacteria bacterium]|nr:PAS domain S-box protein [Deltaproteobacteria bacterium]
MNDSHKSKEQLLAELHELRGQVNELESTRKALTESEDRYRKLFNHAGDAIFLSDCEASIDCNRQALIMFRCTKEQIQLFLNKNNIFSPTLQPGGTDSAALGKTIIREARSGKPQQLEWRYRRFDGTQFDAEVTLNRIIIQEKPQLLSIIRDVTKRKKTEDDLISSQKRFRDLVENSLSGIFIVQDDRMVYANPELKRLFGPLPATFRLSQYEGIYPEDIESVKELHSQVRRNDTRSHEIILRFYPIGKIGSKPDIKVVFCRASTIEYESREAVLFNMMDITRARELEQMLHIQDKMSSLGRVAAGIAHEIRNPLSGINIHLSSLEKNISMIESHSETSDIIHDIRQASLKIEAVIKRVMDFTKPGEPRLVTGDIMAPITAAVDLSDVLLRKSNITIAVNSSNKILLCSMDPQLIEQVMLNLITNAAEAIKTIADRGTIEIDVSQRDEHVRVAVHDSGPGIPVNDQEKIFEPFFTTRSDGSGIGLSITNRIISNHGGSMEPAVSRLGGACLSIQIPVSRGASLS